MTHRLHHLDNKIIVWHEPKLLLQRYRVQDHAWLNKYASFCSAIQHPGFVNITAQYLCPGKTPSSEVNEQCWLPSIHDYFGYRMQNFGDVTIDRMSSYENFQWLRTFGEDELRLFQDIKPPFFFINARILFLPHHLHDPDDGIEDIVHNDWRWKDHWVPVIYKAGYYYICPCEENAVCYRVMRTEKLFFSDEDARQIVKHIIARALGTYCHCDNFSLLLPKKSAQFHVHVNNWDSSGPFEMKYYIPYPLTETGVVPENTHTSVQIVELNDRKIIKSIDFVHCDDIDEESGDE